MNSNHCLSSPISFIITLIITNLSLIISHHHSAIISDDKLKTVELNQTSSGYVRRHRREPAVWGEPAPDYTGVILDGYARFIKALIFVDSKITHHYNYNMDAVKMEILKLVREANDYFYQINVRLIVVDILETQRSDLSLYSFEQYRDRRITKLPIHDFAALISFRYAGGLAFVGGLCTTKAVMLCGFYPHNPPAMGGIFFHEVAHLIGVAHRNFTEFIDVQNCQCSQQPDDNGENSNGCLKIPGYDHDCTLQQMVNMLQNTRCLSVDKKSTPLFTPFTYVDSLALCGNGVLEGTEECDCGIEKYCYNWNCRAFECQQIFKTWQILLFSCALLACVILLFTCCIHRRCLAGRSGNGHRCLKKLCVDSSLISCDNWTCLCRRSHVARRNSNYMTSLRRAGNMLSITNKEQLVGKPQKIDSPGIVVLINENDRGYLVRNLKAQRPKRPPPPPPPILPTTTQDKILNGKATAPPTKPSNLSVKFAAMIEGVYELSNTARKRLSALSSASRLSTTSEFCKASTGQNDYSDSISQKFNDFDDDDDDENYDYDNDRSMDPGEPVAVTNISVQYASIIPSNHQEYVQHSANAVRMKPTPDWPLAPAAGLVAPAISVRHFVKLATRDESFSSNESSRSQFCPSEDTVSTNLSEEDDSGSRSVNDIIKKFSQSNRTK